jgi:quinoprotein relay system zinc metallohydrolase 1
MKLEIRLIFFVFIVFSSALTAASFEYKLSPKQVADNTYVFVGKSEDFSFENGGNIVNTGFIVTSEGVVVIDTGSSLKYGQQMRAAIATVTDKTINRVYITHHHPDHFLGNLAFKDVPVYALDETIKNINNEGAGFADNLYLMVGDWMRGTDVLAPNKIVKAGKVSVGEHQLELLALSGHTSGDMALFDHSTGVLFSGDLIFHKRTLTTPHAEIDQWLKALEFLDGLSLNVIVPGHGAVTSDKAPIKEMIDYLTWLDATFTQAANDGFTMTDAMGIELPKRFHSNTLLKSEFSRSVTHLFSRYENKVFERVN